MATSQTTRAIIAQAHGGPDVLRVGTAPVREPKAGETTIQVKSAGVNFSDLMALSGSYPAPPPPFTPGIEVAGTDLESGKPVMALLDAGGYAERATACNNLIFDAGDLPLRKAGGYLLTTLAAYLSLRTAARLEPGETVLIPAAGGGLGTAAIQVARALQAGKIIGIASTQEKREFALQAGADQVLGYDEPFPAADVVLDGVGGETFAKGFDAAVRFGRVVMVGASSGQAPRFPDFGELRSRSVALVPFSFRALRAANPELVHQLGAEAIELLHSRQVTPPIGASFPLEEATTALAALATRQATGKLVLLPRDRPEPGQSR